MLPLRLHGVYNDKFALSFRSTPVNSWGSCNCVCLRRSFLCWRSWRTGAPVPVVGQYLDYATRSFPSRFIPIHHSSIFPLFRRYIFLITELLNKQNNAFMTYVHFLLRIHRHKTCFLLLPVCTVAAVVNRMCKCSCRVIRRDKNPCLQSVYSYSVSII
jgi:hypothetical protein